MSGPPPKPYLLKVAEGNRGHQKLNPGPQFKTGAPKPPKGLQGEGRKLWKRLAPELEAQGLLAEAYGSALEGLCFNYGRAIAAEKVLSEQGMTFETEKGYVGQRPEVSIAQKSWQAVKAFCGEFGLTPASNGKIIVPKLKKESLRDRLSS